MMHGANKPPPLVGKLSWALQYLVLQSCALKEKGYEAFTLDPSFPRAP